MAKTQRSRKVERVIMHRSISAVLIPVALALSTFAAGQQQPDNQDKHLDIQSSAGDLHVGTDADARKVGLPLYPGARPRHDADSGKASVNLGILTEAFGLKLLVAKYDSDDAPARVIGYYRDKLRKYGKVLECHTHEHGGDINADVDDEKPGSKDLKCEDSDGPVTELKVGTDDNQHIVAVEPRDSGSGSTFALVYVYTRGKKGDI